MCRRSSEGREVRWAIIYKAEGQVRRKARVKGRRRCMLKWLRLGLPGWGLLVGWEYSMISAGQSDNTRRHRELNPVQRQRVPDGSKSRKERKGPRLFVAGAAAAGCNRVETDGKAESRENRHVSGGGQSRGFIWSREQATLPLTQPKCFCRNMAQGMHWLGRPR